MLADSAVLDAEAFWADDGFVYYSSGTTTGSGIMRVPAGGGSPEQVTSVDVQAQEAFHYFPQVLPHAKAVLFTVWYSCHGGGAQIAVVTAATGVHRTLLPGAAARVTPSGDLLVVTEEGQLLSVPFDADRLEVSGNPSVMMDGLAVNNSRSAQGGIDLSVSGRSLAYVHAQQEVAGEGEWELVWVDRQGSAEAAVPGWAVTPSGEGGLSLSSDGSSVAVQSGGEAGDVWIVDLVEGLRMKLTLAGGHRPVSTPDDESILFLAGHPTASHVVGRRRVDGMAGTDTIFAGRPVAEVIQSQDGNWLVVRTFFSAPGAGDILAVPIGAGGPPEPLLNHPDFEESSPTLSQDGRWLAYTSNESGQREVYVRPFPNVGDGVWLISDGTGGTEPRWSPAGGELFYRNATGALVAMSVTTQPTFAPGTSEVLFEGTFKTDNRHREYDVTPDGQRFLMLRRVGRGGGLQREIIMIEGFAGALEGFAGR